MKDNPYGPRNDDESVTFAVEKFILDAQIALHKALQAKGISQKEFARRLGLTPARVSQFFSGQGANMTLRTLGRINAALEDPVFGVLEQPSIASRERGGAEESGHQALTWLRSDGWTELHLANSNTKPLSDIASFRKLAA